MPDTPEIAAARSALAEWEEWAAGMATHCAHGETVAPAFAAALRHLRAVLAAYDDLWGYVVGCAKIAGGDGLLAARIEKLRVAQDKLDATLPCGHPAACAVEAGDGTRCGWCADRDALAARLAEAERRAIHAENLCSSVQAHPTPVEYEVWVSEDGCEYTLLASARPLGDPVRQGCDRMLGRFRAESWAEARGWYLALSVIDREAMRAADAAVGRKP